MVIKKFQFAFQMQSPGRHHPYQRPVRGEEEQQQNRSEEDDPVAYNAEGTDAEGSHAEGSHTEGNLAQGSHAQGTDVDGTDNEDGDGQDPAPWGQPPAPDTEDTRQEDHYRKCSTEMNHFAFLFPAKQLVVTWVSLYEPGKHFFFFESH